MRIHRLVLSLAIPAAVLAAAVPAAASSEPASSLTLSVEDESGELGKVTLECDPPGGTHPQFISACETLAESDGDVSAVNHSDEACVFIYAPVTAKLSGTWDGALVEYQETFPNRCLLVSKKGPVFGF